jgi:hypothetical protein
VKATRWVKHDDVLQNANNNSTDSIPIAQEAWSHGATPFPCVLDYRNTVWRKTFA